MLMPDTSPRWPFMRKPLGEQSCEGAGKTARYRLITALPVTAETMCSWAVKCQPHSRSECPDLPPSSKRLHEPTRARMTLPPASRYPRHDPLYLTEREDPPGQIVWTGLPPLPFPGIAPGSV